MKISIQPKKKELPNFFSIKTAFSLSFLLLSCFFSRAQQVTEIITDFGGYWRTNTTTNNTTKPTDSHNLLAFTVGGTLYSTGANNAILTSNAVSFTNGNFKCLPITSVTGTITTAACAIGLAINYDGVPNGFSNPLPTVKMKDVLTDGINGLDIGTGVIDFPSTAKLTFPIQSIDVNSIADAKPDILFTQIADADPVKTDTMYFVNASNIVVGNKIVITWSSVQVLGNYLVDFYDLQRNVTCDQAVITAGLAANNTRPLRLTAFRLSDFGITSANKASVVSLVLQPSGKSDIGFVAYNTDGFVITPPTITQQPQTQIVCTGAASTATFSVVATGTSDTYQWRKDGVDIAGATSASCTISPVTGSSAGTYDVV
ncbi:MAG: immunoglobulin domain-containing protein, partial [Bacteroidota bacterium]|nr:immunoglobulin domain-containing protein [Bacteroidota bacterium]